MIDYAAFGSVVLETAVVAAVAGACTTGDTDATGFGPPPVERIRFALRHFPSNSLLPAKPEATMVSRSCTASLPRVISASMLLRAPAAMPRLRAFFNCA